jgi:hypothetical protein
MIAWWNGFLSAATVAGIVLLCFGLWHHNDNEIVPGGLFIFFGFLCWVGTLSELID